MTASDDASIVFFTGVPYKNDKVSHGIPERIRPTSPKKI